MLTVVGARSALAQLVTTLDAGASAVAYDDAYRTTTMNITPSLRYEGPRTSLLASGTFSRFETGAFSTNGLLTASVLSSGAGWFRAEVSGSLAGSAPEDGASTGLYGALLRGHMLAGAKGLWLGVGAGQSSAGAEWRLVRSAEAGVWWRHGAMMLAGSVERTGLVDTSYVDVEASARWTRRAFELGVGGGIRGGDGVTESPWAMVNGTWWIGRHFALSAAGGRYLADHVQGIPGGRYMTIGLRVATRPPVVELPLTSRSTLPAEIARPVAGRLELLRTATGGSALRLEAPGARRVELMADFTGWKVVALQPSRDGWWYLPETLPPGTHRFNVRVDDGRWGVPRGVTTITDDFDGVVGILSVR